jgi:acyl carrier protein
MKTETEIRQSLREWIVKTSGKIRPEEINDDTPIIERRIISSLQLTDLILMLERLSDNPIDVEMLKPGVFRDINTIYRNFFQSANASSEP